MKKLISGLVIAFSALVGTVTLAEQGSELLQAWNGKQYEHHSRSQTVDAKNLIQSLPTTGVNNIIDLGCGAGNSMQVIRQHFPIAHITGIDPDTSMLKTAQKLCSDDKNISVLQADALSFHTAQPADLLYAGFVMHWIPRHQQHQALQNINTNLKTGGTVALIFSPTKEGLPFQKALNKLIKQPPYKKALKDFKQTQTFYTVDEYRKLLERSGFLVERIGYSYNKKSYPNSKELELWLQQWLPYGKHLAEISINIRDQFMKDLVQSFIKESVQQEQPRLWWGEYVITAVAHKK